jgi:hypothetical protein
MGGAYLDPEPTARLVKTYVNKFLQQICVGEGMSKFGVKAELQNRIIDSMSHPSLVQDMSDPEASDIHCYLIHLSFKFYISESGFGTLNGIRTRWCNTQTYFSAKLWNIQDSENTQPRATCAPLRASSGPYKTLPTPKAIYTQVWRAPCHQSTLPQHQVGTSITAEGPI